MSLILQALRKSEAQRQLGHAPSLLSPMPDMRIDRRRRGWLGAGYVLLVLLVAMLAWWLGQRGQQPDTDPSVIADLVIASDRSVQPALRPRLPETPALVESGTIARRLPAPALSAATPALEKSALPPASVVATAPTPTATLSPTATLAADARIFPQQPLPTIIAAEPALPTLADLTASERQGLPPLRITMHVFANLPAQRFAIIDGHRVAEGALLGDGIVLVEINRAGVILDLHGRRVLAARP